MAIATIATVLSLAVLLLPLFTVLSARTRAAGAADAAALAAADIAVGILPGIPCEAAATVAKANGASMTGCEPDGAIITVRVAVLIMGFQVVATATAGPPGARAN